MRKILQGLVLSLGLFVVVSHAAENTEVTTLTSPKFAESEEERDAKAVAEIISVPPAVNQSPANAEQVLAEEIKGIKDTKEAQSEAQIPVLATVDKKIIKTSDQVNSLMISLAVILVVASGLFMFARFWAKRKTGLTNHHQIKVLTQYGLGPKKSLAIIRVAGESILIGVTEHNISMIKSLALLDEDLPLEVPQKFDQELDHADQKAATFVLNEKEDFNFGSVRDIVASRIREMRSL